MTHQDTKYVSIAIICVLLVMTLNNYLESQLKILKEKYSWVKRYVQNAGMSTFLGILVGMFVWITCRSALEAFRCNEALSHHQEWL